MTRAPLLGGRCQEGSRRAQLTGVELSQGAITQELHVQTGSLPEAAGFGAHQSVRPHRRTGWRVGGEPAFLMAFETDRATVYQVRARHRNHEVRQVVLGLWRSERTEGGATMPRLCPG